MNKIMERIRIEKVASVDFIYPYLEVFVGSEKNPTIDIGVDEEKQLGFKFYKRSEDQHFNLEEIEYILKAAKDFFSQVLKDVEDFDSWMNSPGN